MSNHCVTCDECTARIKAQGVDSYILRQRMILQLLEAYKNGTLLKFDGVK